MSILTVIPGAIFSGGNLIVAGCILVGIAVLLVIRAMRLRRRLGFKVVKDDIMAPEEIQDLKNIAYVSDLLEDPINALSGEERERITLLFGEWQNAQKNLFATIRPYPREQEALADYLQKGGCALYSGSPISSELPEDMSEYEPYMKDVFTEPFPSHHDMVTWHLSQLRTCIMFLAKVPAKEYSRFWFYAKRHFVSHEMESAIIQVDIYKRK